MGTGVIATAGLGTLAVDTLGAKRWVLKMAHVSTSTCGAEYLNVPVK